MADWCQNPKCPERKTLNQIRGSKGAKYYQSSKANGYGNGNFCTLSCQRDWDNAYMDRAIDVLGIRIYEPVKINLDDAWYVEYKYNWRTEERNRYHLINNLKGIDQVITKQQAQTPEQIADDSWQTIDDTQARELAIQLGLAK
tara:strand:- start:260 stop:688 length:429 start_codon:yes stop_codon:yes gene_type:complete